MNDKTVETQPPQSAAGAQQDAQKVSVPKNGGRRRAVTYTLLLFGLCALAAFLIWYEMFRGHETTDDAYVGGNMVYLTSRQEGSVIAFFADDTDFVEQGQLLVNLDPTDYMMMLEQRKAALQLAARQVSGLYQDVRQREADLVLKKAMLGRAWVDYNNRVGLVESEAIPKEDFEHARASLKEAKASVAASKHQLDAAIAALGSTPLAQHPLIIKAKADAIDAFLALTRCALYAPVTGFVAKRTVQAGQSIKTTTPLLAIIPLDSVWVDANFKETQLSSIRIGQKVDVTADIYGSDVLYHGVVVGIQGGSGSVFSLLPPQNASGNWIKIVQRVPVRISLDPDEVKKHPLFLGLSVYAKVYVEDDSGLMLAEKPRGEVVMDTDIYDVSLADIAHLFDEMIALNLGAVSVDGNP